MHARIGALAVALVLAVAGWANAQVTTTGTIQVVVQDAQGGRLPGVTVTARAEDSVTTRTAVTNAEGVASLEALAPSNAYVVTTELQGFQTQTINAVLVRSGQTATIDLTLAVAGLTEAVTVTADAPIVNTTSATVGQELTLELTESLPTGRSYQSYLQLVPGVLPSATGNPASRSGVNYSDIAGDIGQFNRQLLLRRRHQRHRSADRYVRRQSEHRDHSGAEGAHRRHPRGIRGCARTALQRRHEVGKQQFLRLSELLHTEQLPRRRQRKHRSVGFLDV